MKHWLYKILVLLVLAPHTFTALAQPDPNEHNKQQFSTLTRLINESDTVNYALHWRRAKLLVRMSDNYDVLEPVKKETVHNYIMNDLALLIDNEVKLAGFKEVTIAHYYFTRANYYNSINELDKAITDYKTAIEKDDRNLIIKQTRFKLFSIYESKYNYTNAIEQCNQIIAQAKELEGNYCSCQSKSSLCLKRADLLYKAGMHKELLDYLKDLFANSNAANNNQQEVYCFLNLYKQYYILVTPTQLSKYTKEDINEKSVSDILKIMEKLNQEIE